MDGFCFEPVKVFQDEVNAVVGVETSRIGLVRAEWRFLCFLPLFDEQF
jgi:hypothetical protein